MDNASVILTTLDGQLDHPVRLILYGRAALQLGFEFPPPDAATSMDVDAIIPVGEVEALAGDAQFWAAQEAANARLESLGLYITHLFSSDMVILRRDWESALVKVERPPLRWLQVYRPSAIDLVLTKMMRGVDALDMADAAFLVRTAGFGRHDLELAFEEAVVPQVPEIQDSFARAKPAVLAMAVG